MQIVKGQLLQLPDGSILLPAADNTGSKVVTPERIAEQAAHKEVMAELAAIADAPFDNPHTDTVKRTLADINVDFARMNVIMLVISYTLWGLDKFAIARLLNTTEDNVEAFLESDLFIECREQVIEAVRYAEASSVHGYISSKTLDAAKVISTSLKNASADVRLAAAKDILDRGGFRPVDRVEHVHRFDDELRIRYVRDADTIPTIELDT